MPILLYSTNFLSEGEGEREGWGLTVSETRNSHIASFDEHYISSETIMQSSSSLTALQNL